MGVDGVAGSSGAAELTEPAGPGGLAGLVGVGAAATRRLRLCPTGQRPRVHGITGRNVFCHTRIRAAAAPPKAKAAKSTLTSL